MKIESVLIKNFKSIKEVEIPFNSYGDGTAKSSSTFLVGINECGKSSILEALSLIKKGLNEINYDECCYKPAYDENEYIDIYIKLKTANNSFWVKQFIEKCGIPEEISKKINFSLLEKNIYKKNQKASEQYNVEIEEIPLFEYLIEGEIIKSIKEANAVDEKITKTNAESFLNENQKLLDKENLEEIIADKLTPTFDASFPNVQIWKPEKEYLINSVIDLNTFKENPDTSLPLKYIFHLIGKDTTEKIKIAIERALKSQEKSDELKDDLSDAVTKALNKKWKEHKVKILISINGTNCQVHVQDKDTKNKYYRMNQRSDGFKQFVSLILSLSLLNDSKKLENNIILIDEPEIHLHPSGIQEMRSEILKIGQKNQVFISTHSHYMVDTTCPERHWIVKKEKSQTSITPIDENTPIEDDTVISAAFGLNLFKELLPKNIIVVEGGDDKYIIHHCLKKLSNRFFYSIKSAGGASKMPSVASLLANENVPAFFLFDDDNEGTSNKKKITDNYKDCFNKDNVFTIRDLDNSIPQKSTLEDLMPLSLVKDFFEKELSQTFTLDESSPFLFQLKNQNSSLKENKDKLDSLKLKLSEKFVEEFDTKEKIENEAPKMASLVNNLIQKINNHEL